MKLKKVKIKSNEKKKSTAKKKQNKWKSSKRNTIQSFYDFEKISEGEIKLWNGRCVRFIQITPPAISLVDHDTELRSLIDSLKNVLNNFKKDFSLFIQDQFEDIDMNKQYHIDLLESNDHEFMRDILERDIQLLDRRKSQSGEPVNKDYFIRIEGKELESLESNTKNLFNLLQENELYPSIPTKTELKRMMTYFSLNRYIDFPDSELEVVAPDTYKEFSKREIKRRPEMREIPGVFEFKDFMTPLNFRMHAEHIRNGDNFCRVKGLTNVKTLAEQVPVLEKICTMKNITTMLYFSPLDLQYYSEALDETLKNNTMNATVNNVNEISANITKNAYTSSFEKTIEDEDSMYLVSTYFMLTAKNKMDLNLLEEAMFMKGTTNNLVFDTFVERQKAAFYTVSPLGNNTLKRLICQNYSSPSIAALYPFNSFGFLDRYGFNIGKDNGTTDVLVDFYTIKNDRSNPHIVITGASGKGKTSLMYNLITNFWLANAETYTIDIKNDYADLTKKLGGLNIDLTGENEYAINPLQPKIINGTVNDMANHISEVRRWARCYKPTWDENRLDLFEYYFTKEVKRRNLFEATDLHLRKNGEFPILSDIGKLIEEDLLHHDPVMMAPVVTLQELLRSLSSAITGADQRIFNRHTYLGEGENSRHINFNVFHLLSGDQSRKTAQLQNILTYIAARVYSNTNRSRKIAFFIDELHEFLNKEYMEIINALDSFIRKFRSFNASLILSSQTVEEFFAKEISTKIRTLFSQATYKFYFNPGDVNFTDYKELLQLKDIEVSKLKRLLSGKCLTKFGNTRFILHVRFRKWFESVKNDVHENTVFTD